MKRIIFIFLLILISALNVAILSAAELTNTDDRSNNYPPGTVYIGDPQSNYLWLNAPIAVAWENGVAQTIYYESEFSHFGTITDIILTFNGNAAGDAPPNAIYEFYLTISEINEFISHITSWLPYDDFTLVYSGTLPLNGLSGRHEITIPLDLPFDYSGGGNLVLMGYRQYHNTWRDGNGWIHTLSEYGRTINAVSAENTINPPFTPYPSNGNVRYHFANAAFVFDLSNSGHLTGMVTTGSPPVPLSDVEVQITGSTQSSFTNAEGIFLLENIEAGTIGITASKVGYITYEAENIVIVAGETTNHNFVMEEGTLINVSGRVLGSDNNLPISGASVLLTGYADFPVVYTNAQGLFNIQNVFGNQDYVIVVNATGYVQSEHPISVGITDFDVGDIFAFEMTSPPSNLEVEIIENIAYLSWQAPRMNSEFGIRSSELMPPPTPPINVGGNPRPINMGGVTHSTSRTEFGTTTGRQFESYNIYRGLDDDFHNPSLWVLIDTNITTQSYADPTWADLNGEIYFYAVTAVFTNNNESPPVTSLPLRHLPPGHIFIGSQVSNIHGVTPFNYQYYTSLAQTIYLDEEINFSGTIEKIAYRHSGGGNVPANINHKVWLATTEISEFFSSNDWLPYHEFTLVYEGLLPTNQPGIYDVNIIFDTPFTYTGGNLVVMTQRLSVDSWQNYNSWQHVFSPIGSRTIHAFRDGPDYDPIAPTEGTLISTMPNIVIAFSTADTGNLVGVVTHDSIPLADVEITLNGTNRSVYTNSQGQYQMPSIPQGLIGITAKKAGYADAVFDNISIISGQTTTQNISMTLRPVVTVSGTVISSSTDLGVDNATVTLTGYDNYATTTNNQGDFVINNVYGNAVYTLNIKKEGYEIHIEEFEIINTEPYHFDIILWERALPPKNVKAIDEINQARITWEPPGDLTDKWFSHTQANHLANQIGAAGTTTMTQAQRFSQAQLQEMGVSGADLTRVSFVPRDIEYIISTTVLIYTGGSGSPLEPGTLIHSQLVNVPLVENWVDVILTNHIKIPSSGELWIAIRYVALTGRPMGADAGPAIAGYGDLMHTPSLGWFALSDPIAGNLNMNWSIRAFAEGGMSITGNSGILPTITGNAGILPAINDYTDILAGKMPAFPVAAFPRILTGYNVYRADYTETHDPTLWTTLATNQQNTEYIDTSWENIISGAFHYVVRAIYTNDASSDPRFSNLLAKNMTSEVTISLTSTDGSPVNGAVFRLQNNSGNPEHIYQQTASGSSVVFTDVWLGEYTLTISRSGYLTHIDKSFLIQTNILTHNVTMLATEIILQNDFSALPFPPTGWTIIDADGDGRNWIRTNDFSEHSTPPTPWFAASESAYLSPPSWISLTPDNYLITEPFSIPIGGGAMVSFEVGTISPDYPAETYSVMVSNTTPDIEAFTTIFTETLNASFAVWQKREIVVHEHWGENVYIAIRHHNSENNHFVGIANFSVAVSEEPPNLEPPTDLTFEIIEDYTVVLNWQSPANSIPDGYRVFRNDTIIANLINETSFSNVISETGSYIYSVRAVYPNGISMPISTPPIEIVVSEDDETIILETKLTGNFPNPFNPITTISFELAVESIVSIEIFNIRGQRVQTLIDDIFEAGRHSVEWNGTDESGRSVGSGVYFYRMTTEDMTETRRMVLLK